MHMEGVLICMLNALHVTRYTLHAALYALRSTRYTLRSTLYALHAAINTPQFAWRCDW